MAVVGHAWQGRGLRGGGELASERIRILLGNCSCIFGRVSENGLNFIDFFFGKGRYGCLLEVNGDNNFGRLSEN